MFSGLNVVWRLLLLKHALNVFTGDLQDSLEFSRVFQLYVFCLSLEESQEFRILRNHLHFLLGSAVTMSEHCYYGS